MKILTVEDDLIQAMLLERYIENAGHECIGNAVNALDAIQMINSQIPDLILSDIKIEGSKDGIMMMEEIRSYSAIPVVFITGNSNPVYIERAGRIILSRFLVKPILYNTFLRTIQSLENETILPDSSGNR
ncbi:MAG: response regulator [Bacteroidales bacterium]|nr:response regulator [Bacteroidales bacterium]